VALLVAGPLLAVAVAAYFYVTGGRYASTDNAYVKTDMATISAEVEGRVIAVPVVDNQTVTAGTLLFKLDDQPFRLALARTEPELATTRDDILADEAAYRQKLAEIDLAQKNIDFYQRELKIYEDMASGKIVAQTQLDEAHHNLTVAQQQLPALQQELAGTLARLQGEPDIAPEQHPRYLAAAAARDQAALDLEHTAITAPADGTVANLTLRPGDYVKSGTPVFSLVEAGHAWVEANFKETDLTYVRAGQPATLSVDTYPGSVWQGRVESIGPASGSEFALLPPQNSTGNWIKVVQRIPVRIAIDNPDRARPLRAGMSVVVEIDTRHRHELPSIVKSALVWVGAAP
jgi:membrane fusion protein (multidrug efflux system)